jgi:hypothetical protein
MAKLACLIQQENSQQEVLEDCSAGLIYNTNQRVEKGHSKRA